MTEQKLLLFRKWDTTEIIINDIGLKTAISLKQIIIPLDFGRSALKRFNKAEVNIVERLANKLMHFGKKYAKNTGRMGGKKTHSLNVVKTAFEIINLKTGKNPVEILVRSFSLTFQVLGHCFEREIEMLLFLFLVQAFLFLLSCHFE